VSRMLTRQARRPEELTIPHRYGAVDIHRLRETYYRT
jgi:hypothetical protein